MIDLFGKKYIAISNLFVYTIEEERYTFPCPLSAVATLENGDKNTTNSIEFRFSSYFDSILVLDSAFKLTCFLLTPYYGVEVLSVEDMIKKEDTMDTYGYKASFSFQEGALSMNIMQKDIYSSFKKFQKEIK
jgi:hypothetical protein